MTIFEIDEALQDLIDPETGELRDYEAFEALSLERDAKIENTACWVIDLNAEAAAIRAEEAILAERRKKLENRAEQLKEFLARATAEQPFKSARVSVTWRKSKSLQVADEAALIDELQFREMDEFLTYKTPAQNKTAITRALKEGTEFPGCVLVEKNNMTVK